MTRVKEIKNQMLHLSQSEDKRSIQIFFFFLFLPIKFFVKGGVKVVVGEGGAEGF